MKVSLFRQLRQVAMLLEAEFRKSQSSAEASKHDPRTLLLRSKTIYELGYSEGSVPDGLSETYILLAAARNSEVNRLDYSNQHLSPLTRLLATAVDHEIATARVLELHLLKMIEKSPCE